MTNSMFDRKFLVLLSACLLSMVLGSVHAFSVFLEPLEERFDQAGIDTSGADRIKKEAREQ